MDDTLHNNQTGNNSEQEISKDNRSNGPQGEDERNAAGNDQASDIEAKCAEYLAGWKRAQADYLNLKRESERERLEFSRFANERLLSSLLPAIDQFEMAMSFIPQLSNLAEADQKKFDNWITGLKAVRSGWESAFKDIGLEQIPVTGTFDPFLHEAVGEEVADGKNSGEILRVVQSGWRLHGKVLRPAKAIITK